MEQWLMQQRVLSQGNCPPDSYMEGLLECNIDLEQNCTGKLAVDCVGAAPARCICYSVRLLSFELASPSASAAEQVCGETVVTNIRLAS